MLPFIITDFWFCCTASIKRFCFRPPLGRERREREREMGGGGGGGGGGGARQAGG